MLIITESDKSDYAKLSSDYMERNGHAHDSASSIAALLDCQEKSVLRRHYRSTGLELLLGVTFHDFLDKLGKLLLHRVEVEKANTGRKYAKLLDKFVRENHRALYDGIVHRKCEDIPIDVITKNLLCKEKQYDIMKDVRRLVFIFDKMYAIFTPELLYEIFEEVPILTEVGGYYRYNDDCLLYGFIDKVSLVANDTLRITDYKFKFSKRATNLINEQYMFQVWLYKKMVKEYTDKYIPSAKNMIPTLQFIKVNMPSDIRVLWTSPEALLEEKNKKEIARAAAAGRKPKVFKKMIEPFVPDAEIVNIDIDIKEEDEIRFDQRVNTAVTLRKCGLGIIADSHWGCGMCEYQHICVHGKRMEEIEAQNE